MFNGLSRRAPARILGYDTRVVLCGSYPFMPNSSYRLPLVDLRADDAEIGRYAKLLDTLGIGLLVFAADGTLQSRNVQAGALLGETTALWEDENGRPLATDDRLEMQVLHSRQPVRQRAVGIRKVESAPVIRCTASAVPVLANDGSVRRVLLTLTDLKQRLAAHSALNGVFSEADIVLLLDDEGRRARRYGTPFAIALMAIDHFPEFCEARGAQAGEQVLADVGQLLCQGLREFDMVGRFSADKFLLILPNVSVNDAIIGLERLRELVETTGPLTISGGVSEFTGEDSATLIERVHSLLTVARESGCNRLCLSLDFF